MNHVLRATVIAAIFGLHAHGQDAYINGQQWYGHEVDRCYLDFDAIQDQGDPEGTFAYAKNHLRTITQFSYGEPVIVLRTRKVRPDDVTLTLVRRVGESTTYWTDPAALSTIDLLARDRAAARAVRLQAAQEEAEKAQEKFKSERRRRELARAAAETPCTKRPIAIERYWQIGKERLRGKMVNANNSHVKILKSNGDTIVVDRRHLSETSDSYVSSMLYDLETFQMYQAMLPIFS